MSDVSITQLVKRFGDFEALHGIDLEIAEGEFVTLLGPSGCGKTTTLRCLAGLEAPSEGTIVVGDRVFASAADRVFVPPEDRNVGMVFQSYALWPHMTVRSNVGYPLKLSKRPRAEIRRRVREILERIGLADRELEMAASLSGGQQQRIALARALVAHPSLMLFDEPLSNLDAKLRQGMRKEIRTLHDAYGMTSIYVTHDQEEAIALSDRVVVMNLGRIEQIGKPRALYTRPASVFVADFMGFQNILEATVVAGDGQGYRIAAGGLDLDLGGRPPAPVGSVIPIAFRASHVTVNAPEEAPGSRFAGRVVQETYLGSSVQVLVDAGATRVLAEIAENDFERLGTSLPRVTDEVELTLRPHNVVGLPPEGPAGETGGRRPQPSPAGCSEPSHASAPPHVPTHVN